MEAKIALEFFNLKTIEENNALIAEFMGAELGNGTEENPIVYINIPTYYGEQTYSVKQMQYHKRWDWLMPVIEKLERTNLDHIKEVQDTMLGKNHKASINLMNERCILWIAPNWTLANMFSTDNRLGNAYYCVVKFIEWYNENS